MPLGCPGFCAKHELQEREKKEEISDVCRCSLVRVELPREDVVAALDLGGWGVRRDAEQVVVAPVSNGRSGRELLAVATLKQV